MYSVQFAFHHVGIGATTSSNVIAGATRPSEAFPHPERDARQIVRRRREIRGAIELRHRMETAVKREPSAVITTAQLLLVARAFDDECPAMRTHIRQRMDVVMRVTCQK